MADSSPPKPTGEQLQSFRVPDATYFPPDIRQFCVAQSSDILNVADQLCDYVLKSSDPETAIRAVIERIFVEATSEIELCRTIALVCRAMYERFESVASKAHANYFKELIVYRMITQTIKPMWELMKTQGKKSIFTTPAAAEEAVAFFADIYAIGLIAPEVFVHRVRELAAIPHDVDQAYLVLILLSRGLSYRGCKLTKPDYVEISKGVYAIFQSKRSEEDIFSDFKDESIFRGFMNALMREGYQNPTVPGCTLPFTHFEDDMMSCYDILALKDLGIEAVEESDGRGH